MIVIVNYNKKNKKFLPMLGLANSEKELRKAVKKQLVNNILDDPKSITAYKDIEVFKLTEINETEMKLITEWKKEKLFSYEEILNEIIETLEKEK